MKDIFKRVIAGIFALAMPLAFLSCTTMEPQNMQLSIEETKPEVKVTNLKKTMDDFGLLMEIYRDEPTKLMVREVTDKTGAAAASGAEIQHNITEIVKSTLNSMGENVIFIEYDPEFVAGMASSGYKEFTDKLEPDVVVSGAITEFDRALVGWEKGINVDADADFTHVKKGLPTQSVSVGFEDGENYNKARITLDFNLKSMRTNASIPGMNVSTQMEVQKGVRKQEFGLTLFGPTFGSKGSLKKVQGRHDAVRLLVQTSMIQLVGKQAGVPYWRILGNDAVQDDSVMKSWRRAFPGLPNESKVVFLQKYLYLHGYDVPQNGEMDEKTSESFTDFMNKNKVPYNTSNGWKLDSETFLKVYLTVPLNEETYSRAQSRIAVANQGGNSGQPKLDDLGRANNLLTEAYGYFSKQQYEKAAQLFEESLKAAQTPIAYYFLALCSQSLQNSQKALAYLEQGVKNFDTDFPLWRSLGMSYSQAGNNAAAKGAFQKALELRPNDEKIKFLMQRL